MAMDESDRRYFEGKFEAQTKATTDLTTAFEVHKATPCKDATAHEEKFHGPDASERERKKIKAIARDEIARAVPTSTVARWKHIAGAVAALATIVGGIVAVILAFA